MSRELITVIEQIGREKGIDPEVLFEAVESALLSASRKTMGAADNLRMEIDRKTGVLKAYGRKKVVEDVTDPKLEISLADAKALNPAAELDDELEQELPHQEFGRIAAQTAKQVILQRVRDAERERIFAEFTGKDGQIIRGVVHRIEKRNVIVEVGKAEAVLPEREQIPGERYNPGDRVRTYVLEVRRSAKGPQITLSRTHPGYLVRLFETEIPEIQEGIVVVKAAAREAGERAKVAVASTKRDVDPIGACVGLRGTRIQVISRELRGEKIDIIEWSHDPATFVARALSPAKVASVTISAEPDSEGQASALVIVPDNQLSLAIGKKGQNARLAAKLTGMRIDIRSESELEAEAGEAAEGQVALASLGLSPEQVEALVGAGLVSPAAIVRAGRDALAGIAGVAEQAERLYAAAEAWVVAQAAAAPDEASAAESPHDGGAP
ncbi:MAG: transcription termination/antitermination protein NusA [Candidatus Rokubacteria bacterium]|nr:transcription termination/antitermination protein NusA [Candidatus Rokubacteria bacterium]